MRAVKLLIRSATEPLARFLVSIGVSANALTVAGFLLNGVAAVFVALGFLPTGGLLYLVFSSLDFLDGAVARLSGSAGPFGAFFDSVLDRASEAVVLSGLIYWFAAAQQPVLAVLCGIALSGSFLVSYARARAEGLGLDCEVGWLQRPERIVLLGLGLMASPIHPLVLPATLLILACVSSLTTVQRIAHVAALTRTSSSPSK